MQIPLKPDWEDRIFNKVKIFHLKKGAMVLFNILTD